MSTVFLATPSQRFLFSSLVDLSASGLLKDFSWAEFPAQEIPGQILSVRDGKISVIRTATGLNQAGSTDRQVCFSEIFLISRRATNLSLEQENAFFERHHLPQGVTAEKQRLVLPWEKLPVPDFTQRLGWVNLVVSPEISSNPREAPDSWWDQGLKREAVTVSNIVTLSHLWKGSPDNTAEQLFAETDLRVVKTYVRGANNAKTREQLLDDVLTYDTVYQPIIDSSNGADVPLVPDSRRSAQAMAGRWWQRAQTRVGLEAYPPPPPTEERQNISASAAIAQFFRFLAALIVGLPKAFLNEAVRSASMQIAGFVERTVYGEDSPYRVIVQGLDKDGRLASWKEINDSADALATESGSVVRDDQNTGVGLGEFVKDFFAAGLTLADGGVRTSAIEPAMVNHQPAIVQGAAFISPDSQDWKFRTEHAQLCATDVLQIESEIKRLSDSSASTVDAENAAKLRAWRDRILSSFVGQCALILAGAFSEIRQTAQGVGERLQGMKQRLEEITAVSQDSSKPLQVARWLSLLFILLIAAAGVAWYLWHEDYQISVWYLVAAIVIICVIWLISMLLCFRPYSEIANLEREVKQIQQMIPYLHGVMAVAARNATKISDAQLTLEVWAPVLAEFIHRPLGHPDENKETYPAIDNLAEAVQITYTSIPDTIYETKRVQMRRDWQNRGWATNFWDHVVLTFPQILPEEILRQRFQGRAKEMFNLRYNDLALQRLRQEIVNKGVGDVIRQLARQSWMQSSLDEQVRHGNQTYSVEEFCNQVGQPGLPTSSSLPDEIFTLSGKGGNKNTATLANRSDFDSQSTHFSQSWYLSPRLESWDLEIFAAQSQAQAPELAHEQDSGATLRRHRLI